MALVIFWVLPGGRDWPGHRVVMMDQGMNCDTILHSAENSLAGCPSLRYHT